MSHLDPPAECLQGTTAGKISDEATPRYGKIMGEAMRPGKVVDVGQLAKFTRVCKGTPKPPSALDAAVH